MATAQGTRRAKRPHSKIARDETELVAEAAKLVAELITHNSDLALIALTKRLAADAIMIPPEQPSSSALFQLGSSDNPCINVPPPEPGQEYPPWASGLTLVLASPRSYHLTLPSRLDPSSAPAALKLYDGDREQAIDVTGTSVLTACGRAIIAQAFGLENDDKFLRPGPVKRLWQLRYDPASGQHRNIAQNLLTDHSTPQLWNSAMSDVASKEASSYKSFATLGLADAIVRAIEALAEAHAPRNAAKVAQASIAFLSPVWLRWTLDRNGAPVIEGFDPNHPIWRLDVFDGWSGAERMDWAIKTIYIYSLSLYVVRTTSGPANNPSEWSRAVKALEKLPKPDTLPKTVDEARCQGRLDVWSWAALLRADGSNQLRRRAYLVIRICSLQHRDAQTAANEGELPTGYIDIECAPSPPLPAGL